MSSTLFDLDINFKFYFYDLLKELVNILNLVNLYGIFINKVRF